jgi:hypothetical protein
MECPYCDQQISEDEFDIHCLKIHPDKTGLEGYRQETTARMWATATELTLYVFGSHGSNKKEEVLETFKYFLRELMKSE